MGLWRMKGREIDAVCWRDSLSAPVQAPGYQDNLQIEGNPQRGLGANKRPPTRLVEERCRVPGTMHAPDARVSTSEK